MAAILADHMEIAVIKTLSGNTPQTRSIVEKASQTFLSGTPVMLSNGVIKDWDAVVGAVSPTVGIAGVTRIAGSNLATDGKGAPGTFEPVGAPGAQLTQANVPYQSSAVSIPRGSPMSDGRTIFEVANEDTFFVMQFDDAGGVAATATTAQTMVGKQFGLTKDTTGHWYVDAAKVTVGTNTVVEIVQLHPNDGPRLNGRVIVKFIKAIQQLAA